MYVNNDITKTRMKIKYNLLMFLILFFLIQLLFNHNTIRVRTPTASMMPPNKAFEELGGTPTLLVKTAIPGITANTPDAMERKSETFFIAVKILSRLVVLAGY